MCRQVFLNFINERRGFLVLLCDRAQGEADFDAILVKTFYLVAKNRNATLNLKPVMSHGTRIINKEHLLMLAALTSYHIG